MLGSENAINTIVMMLSSWTLYCYWSILPYNVVILGSYDHRAQHVIILNMDLVQFDLIINCE